MPPLVCFGAVIPKRQVRRAVMRSLLKRQIRGAFARHAATLPEGLWLVRVRQPFTTAAFPSAASERLRMAVRKELDELFAPSALRADRADGTSAAVPASSAVRAYDKRPAR
jgi:ribonuclease P protein component